MANKGNAAVAALVLLLLLAGCGSKDGTNGGNAAQGAAPTQMNHIDGGFSRDNGGFNRMQADLMGKVKSISGQTLTVYKSSFQPEQDGPGAGMEDRRPPTDGGQGQGDNGQGGQQRPEGQAQGNGNWPQRDGADGGNSQSPAGERSRGDFNMNRMFTDETVDLQVTDATKIVKRSFEDGQMTETEMAIGDLQADDIVSVDLKDDTLEAVTITLNNNGGLGSEGMGGFRGPGG